MVRTFGKKRGIARREPETKINQALTSGLNVGLVLVQDVPDSLEVAILASLEQSSGHPGVGCR